MLLGQVISSAMTPAGAGVASTKDACINNLRRIDSAKEQCALERNLSDGAAENCGCGR